MREHFGKSQGIADIVVYAVVITWAALCIVPVLWIVSLSFKTNSEVFAGPWTVPANPSFATYRRVWSDYSLGTYFFNSLYYTVASLLLTVVASLMVSYAIVRLRVRYAAALYAFLIAGVMIPHTSLIIPLYSLILDMGLFETRASIILVYFVYSIPVAVALFCAYLKSIPIELEEAAVIDGCNPMMTFLRVIVPLCAPAVATVTILRFLRSWNDFLFALVFSSRTAMRTLPVGIASFKDDYGTDYNNVAAGMVIAVLPAIAVFVAFQERIVRGISAGAVKG